ncbi:respiratory nitrate reductase subunit gamma [Pseudohalioglobus sediminis]|uniref:nitrate reductase (quinone) n=1 Tax=Pseudohalioglobus sediminis TaxID=2606449 RepID=A0A5B0WXL0_9GAMM|nr:respiratory nitrate reductase subunit gamma [Pseudohalioglobus sediminis]KAA1191802.1 respiratory nitrate reductase subunit gamma [Pseudohalioglobus sediminis]
MNTMNFLLFGIYPYIAVTTMIVGSWARYDREQYTWKTGSSQILNDKGMRWGSNLFHIGVLFIIFGHFVGLLTPESIYHYVISTPQKQVLAMASGGFFGALAFIGLTILIKRRFTDVRIRKSSNPSDLLVLLLLYAQLILGLLSIGVSAGHMDGSVMVLLANWAQGIVTFRPEWASANIANVHIIYKLHVFLGMTLFVVFPFTRLVHIASGFAAPVKYLTRNYQIVRSK